MNWIVSKSVINSDEKLKHRQQYIATVAGIMPSAWSEERSIACDTIRRLPEYYICRTKKGEYGIIITAHIYEVKPILNTVLSHKRAIVVVNSCMLNNAYCEDICRLVFSKNHCSELYFAKQESQKTSNPSKVNYMDNVGTFGFDTTNSERELFMNRTLGLIPAIKRSFDRI